MIKIRPYLLRNTIQHYAWGMRGKDAFIPKFIGADGEDEKPYAELWIGAHPKAPSHIEIDGAWQSLHDVLARYPNQFLGERVAKKFSNQLPFLFKVLSAAEPLSIQTHPNTQQAKILHDKNAINYPDDNHKPEIAIALDGLTALVGFKSYRKIIDVFETYPMLVACIGEELFFRLHSAINADEDTQRALMKEMYSTLMHRALCEEKLLAEVIAAIEHSILITSKGRNETEQLFLDAKKIYGVDVGLISIFLLNLIHLKEGEGIFTEAGVPHAYIKGNIVECMANSDNVVRAGLTQKFKDVETLTEILTYRLGEVAAVHKDIAEYETSYRTPADEFQISKLKLSKNTLNTISENDTVQIFLVAEGAIELQWKDHVQQFQKGNALLLPAMLSTYSIRTLSDAMLFKVTVP